MILFNSAVDFQSLKESVGSPRLAKRSDKFCSMACQSNVGFRPAFDFARSGTAGAATELTSSSRSPGVVTSVGSLGCNDRSHSWKLFSSKNTGRRAPFKYVLGP